MVAAIVVKTFVFWPISAWMTARVLGCSLWAYLGSMRGPATATLGMSAVLLLVPFGEDWGQVASQVLVGAVSYAALLILSARSQLNDVFNLFKKAKPA